MAAVCEELIDLALDGGSTDNISAVVSSTYTPRSLLFTRAWLCTGGLFRFLRDCIACVGTVQVVQLPGAKVYEGVGEGLSGRRVARGDSRRAAKDSAKAEREADLIHEKERARAMARAHFARENRSETLAEAGASIAQQLGEGGNGTEPRMLS